MTANSSSKILVVAAGTGGHIFPALAVAHGLVEKNFSVLWMGTPQGMENTLVPKEVMPFVAIPMKGFRGKGLMEKLKMPLRLLGSVFFSIKFLMKSKPDLVLCFGGYVTLPAGIAAKLLGKKLVIHEQNSVAGSANKMLSFIADNVLVAFEGVLKKEIVIGNPLRDSILRLYNTQAKISGQKKRNLLVLGGSLGAKILNDIVPEVILSMSSEVRPYVWHQTGKGKQADVVDCYRDYHQNTKVEEFVSNMEEAYQWADLIICRAGALTVSEIAVTGLPAIFIPYPHAIDNHQEGNAKWLVNKDAALMLVQKDLTVSALKNVLESLLEDNERIENMRAHLRSVAKPEATKKFVSICESHLRSLKDVA